ncbi:uncharacterized protein VICG_00380 [Vittaforma corneae ATCC 50505]|uniref:Uncharacterized protein n=1 Tax=Vittaforma corneae (strain ATCC 50505) TaxID=993615 RepID=L2GP33_VITCO|nr:uncharacterized protein VICG_00380 [Vittaforma corneae ATCC 50505]ELA42628.1 hypothetical protein VICG_00380 [Vittaforma corneae ATCC 50505]
MFFYSSLLFTFLCSLLAYFLIQRIKSRLTKESEARRFNMQLKSTYFPNYFQAIDVYSLSGESVNNEDKKVVSNLPKNVVTLFTTTTLRSRCDIYALLYTDGISTFHINLDFAIRAPCFYIYKKSIPFIHVGKTFSKPFLLNKSKYHVYGNISDILHDFICKFDVEYFYSSYLPTTCSENEKKCSTVELKARLDSVDGEFLCMFLKIFSHVEYENENKYQRIIKEFRLMKSQEEAYENLGFLQKLDKYLYDTKNK